MVGWILLAILGLILVWLVLIYNSLVSVRNDVQSSWKQIEVQLKRRHDLIPNLVQTVKGAMEFEQDTLIKCPGSLHGRATNDPVQNESILSQKPS